MLTFFTGCEEGVHCLGSSAFLLALPSTLCLGVGWGKDMSEIRGENGV